MELEIHASAAKGGQGAKYSTRKPITAKKTGTKKSRLQFDRKTKKFGSRYTEVSAERTQSQKKKLSPDYGAFLSHTKCSIGLLYLYAGGRIAF